MAEKSVFCTEQGEYVICDGKCTKCEIFIESIQGKYGKNYP